MKSDPDAMVSVVLLPHERGGRLGPTPSTAYGCIMVIDGRNLDVRFRLDRTGPLQPGAAADVGVDFLCPELARLYLRVGSVFQLKETGIVGNGTVKTLSLSSERIKDQVGL